MENYFGLIGMDKKNLIVICMEKHITERNTTTDKVSYLVNMKNYTHLQIEWENGSQTNVYGY